MHGSELSIDKSEGFVSAKCKAGTCNVPTTKTMCLHQTRAA